MNIDLYKEELESFDWIAASIDPGINGAAWYEAQQTLQRLRALQAEVDPTGEIWNALKPPIVGAANPVVKCRIRIGTTQGSQDYAGVYSSIDDAKACARKRATDINCSIEVAVL